MRIGIMSVNMNTFSLQTAMIEIKSEFKQKLVELGVEDKFMARLNESCNIIGEPVDFAIGYLNKQPTWKSFIFGAFITDDFWKDIAEK